LKNNLIVLLNGEIPLDIVRENNIVLSKEKLDLTFNHNLLQIEYENIEDIVKADLIISQEFTRIDSLVIINNHIDLNMLSYQYNFEHYNKVYSVLSNLIFLINGLIKLFDTKIEVHLILEKDHHFKIHQNNLNQSIKNYLNSLKQDLKGSVNIEIKKLN